MLQHKSIKIFPPDSVAAKSGPQANSMETNVASPSPGLKAISFGDLVKPLAEAFKQNQQWVEDFGQEKIILPADLHDIVMMFGKLQQGNARRAQPEQDPPNGEMS